MAYSGGLRKWFREQWVDVKTGEPCGRPTKKKKGKKRRSYPACRPKAVAAKMSSGEKSAISRQKKGKKRVSWSITPSGRRKKK